MRFSPEGKYRHKQKALLYSSVINLSIISAMRLFIKGLNCLLFLLVCCHGVTQSHYGNQEMNLRFSEEVLSRVENIGLEPGDRIGFIEDIPFDQYVLKYKNSEHHDPHPYSLYFSERQEISTIASTKEKEAIIEIGLWGLPSVSHNREMMWSLYEAPEYRLSDFFFDLVLGETNFIQNQQNSDIQLVIIPKKRKHREVIGWHSPSKYLYIIWDRGNQPKEPKCIEKLDSDEYFIISLNSEASQSDSQASDITDWPQDSNNNWDTGGSSSDSSNSWDQDEGYHSGRVEVDKETKEEVIDVIREEIEALLEEFDLFVEDDQFDLYSDLNNDQILIIQDLAVSNRLKNDFFEEEQKISLQIVLSRPNIPSKWYSSGRYQKIYLRDLKLPFPPRQNQNYVNNRRKSLDGNTPEIRKILEHEFLFRNFGVKSVHIRKEDLNDIYFQDRALRFNSFVQVAEEDIFEDYEWFLSFWLKGGELPLQMHDYKIDFVQDEDNRRHRRKPDGESYDLAIEARQAIQFDLWGEAMEFNPDSPELTYPHQDILPEEAIQAYFEPNLRNFSPPVYDPSREKVLLTFKKKEIELNISEWAGKKIKHIQLELQELSNNELVYSTEISGGRNPSIVQMYPDHTYKLILSHPDFDKISQDYGPTIHKQSRTISFHPRSIQYDIQYASIAQYHSGLKLPKDDVLKLKKPQVADYKFEEELRKRFSKVPQSGQWKIVSIDPHPSQLKQQKGGSISIALERKVSNKEFSLRIEGVDIPIDTIESSWITFDNKSISNQLQINKRNTFHFEFPQYPSQTDSIKGLIRQRKGYNISYPQNKNPLNKWKSAVLPILYTGSIKSKLLEITRIPEFNLIYVDVSQVSDKLLLYDKLEQLLQTIEDQEDRYLLYISNSNNPYIARTSEDYSDLLNSISIINPDIPSGNIDKRLMIQYLEKEDLVPERAFTNFHFFLSSYSYALSTEVIVGDLLKHFGPAEKHIKKSIYVDKRPMSMVRNFPYQLLEN